MNNNKIIYSTDPVEWIIRASMDYDFAKHGYDNMYPKPLEAICELCQKCAEKAIKAVYLALPDYTDGYPRTHDIDFLLNQIKNFVQYDENFKFYSVLLTGFKGKFNYPANIEIDETITKKGLDYTKEILKWAKEVVYHKDHIIKQKTSEIQK